MESSRDYINRDEYSSSSEYIEAINVGVDWEDEDPDAQGEYCTLVPPPRNPGYLNKILQRMQTDPST